MVFLFDSLCAAVLLFSAVLSWGMAADTSAPARLNIRFAAVMLAMLSAARALPSSNLALDMALLTPSLAVSAVLLALSPLRRASVLLSCLILVAGLAAGLLAAIVDMPVLALGYQVVLALVIFAWSLSRASENPQTAILSNLGAMALLFGAMATMNASLSAAMLFFAAFLLLVTRALQAAIAEQRRQRQWLISGKHA